MEIATEKTIDKRDKLAFFKELSKNSSLIRMRGKQPIEKGWQKYCVQRRDFENIGFTDNDNVGIATGPASNLLVIDVDNMELFETKRKEQDWEMPETTIVKTGMGRLHYYFQYPKNGKKYKNKAFKDHGFDIRGIGGVVVAPGSIHPDTGKSYRFINDSQITPAPEWLLTLCEDRLQGGEHDLTNDVTPREVGIEALPILLKIKRLIKQEIAKGERSEAIMSVINALVGISLSEEQILGIFEKYPIGEKYHEKGHSKVKWLKKQIIKAKEYQANSIDNYEIKEIDKPKESSPLSQQNMTCDREEIFHGRQFMPMGMINQIKQQHDILHDETGFWFYDNSRGVWLDQNDLAVGQLIMRMLGERANQRYVKETMYLLRPETFKPSEELKHPRELINLSNGMLNIRSGEIIPHNKAFYSRIQIPVAYDPDAGCPRFLQFLNELFPDHNLTIRSLQDFAGYCLLPEVFIHKCLFLIGSGANGKSVFINTLIKIIGKENVSALELHQLSNKFLLGNLKDKLLNVSSEVQTRSPVDSSIFKQVVSGDLVQADMKYKQPFSFRPIAKHIFSMNEPPVITDRTHAMSRRLLIVKFNQTFDGIREDKHLEDKLSKELPGILNWCLEGLSKVLENENIIVSKQMVFDKKEFMRAINPILTFADECCQFGDEKKVLKSQLYWRYTASCEESGLRSLSKIKFYGQLISDFPQISEIRPDGRERYFVGISTIT